MTQHSDPASNDRHRGRTLGLGAAVFAASVLALALAVPVARRLWRARNPNERSLSGRTIGAPCPRCHVGVITYVGEHEDLGEVPIAAAQTRYRCSQGCMWVDTGAAPAPDANR
jgi:hypothetical protein